LIQNGRDGREYIRGKRFSLADIHPYGWLDFGAQVGQPLDTANSNIAAWFARRSLAKT
jgi:glutathione S-transferase